MGRWLHLEKDAAGRESDTVIHMKLDEIKDQIATIHSQHLTTPIEEPESSLSQTSESNKQAAFLTIGSHRSSEDLQVHGDDNIESSPILKAQLESENQGFQQALSDCIQSAHDFVSSTRTVMGSRASAAGSTVGFDLTSRADETFTSERRLGIEKWIASPSAIGKLPAESAGLDSLEPSTLSRAERQFVEKCEEVEQLGRDGKNEEAADIGMRYLHDLWDHYGPRLHEKYNSDSYQDTYMTDEIHGQQLRRDVLEGQGNGFTGPEGPPRQTYTVLHFLAHVGCSAELRLLLLRKKVNPNIQDHGRKTPLIRAAHMGHKSVVAYLLTRPGIEVSTPDKNACTALDYATLNNHIDIVELFLKHLEIDPVRDQYYISRPFLLASQRGRLSIVKLFASRAEFDINHKGEDQETALHSAIIEDQFAIVQFLLRLPDIDIERTNGREQTPLLCAAWYQRRHILHELLDQPGVNLDHCGSNGRTPLSYVAARGDKVSVRRLLDVGADPDIADKFGILPIVYGASKCYINYNGDHIYPLEKKQPEEHFELVDEFLLFYKFKSQASDIVHRYIDLCTQYVKLSRVRINPLHGLDLSSRWFREASSNHIGESHQLTPSDVRAKNMSHDANPPTASLQKLTLRERQKPSESQDIQGIPICWRFLLDRERNMRPKVLIEDLKSIKETLDNHYCRLRDNNVVHASEIAAISSEYEGRVASYLKDSTLFNAPGASLPKTLIATAMLRQRSNVVFVLGPSGSGKSKFISLTCGNVGKRIRAVEKLGWRNLGRLKLLANVKA